MQTLRIFISGTIDDMIPERETADRAIHALRLKAVRAEAESSDQHSSREKILAMVRDCDIYLGLYNHTRYGWSIPGEDVSPTEVEFNEAQRLGKPSLIFVKKRQAEELEDSRQKEFLTRVLDFDQGKFRAPEFENTSELEEQVARALMGLLVDRFDEVASTSKQMTPKLPVKFYRKFVGREKPLRQLTDALRDMDGKSITVIDGLGGIGKTALAREAVDLALRDRLVEDVIWESAQAEVFTGGGIRRQEPASIDFSLLVRTIAIRLGRRDILDLKTTFEKAVALRALLDQHRILVVLDNIDTIPNYRELVHQLPEMFQVSKAVLTSRYKLSEFDFVYSIPLSGLEPTEAIDYLQTEAEWRGITLFKTASEDSLKSVHAATGGLPLALRLIVGQATLLSLDAILGNLRNAKLAVTDVYTDFYQFLYRKTWELLSDDAQELLLSMGTLSETGGAESDVLGISKMPPNVFNRAVYELTRVSLVEIGGAIGHRRLSLHPITHQFVQSDLFNDWDA